MSLFELSAPIDPDVHLIATELGQHVLVVDGSRLYDVDEELAAQLAAARAGATSGPHAADVPALLRQLGLDGDPFVDDRALETPPLRALSLAVAQKCNLGCAYCYAEQGSFGGPAVNMPREVALRAVDLLFADATPGEPVTLAFLGGEPLINRSVVHAATERAARRAAEMGAAVKFSITTNGTLLTAADGDFFEHHAFAVTVSLDGVREVHDRLRPLRSGRGSYERILSNVMPLLERQRRMQVSARVTVTPLNLELPRTLEHLIELGFHSVGFSPLISSPTGAGEMSRADLAAMLDQMVACGERFERHVIAGGRYPFANMVNAMHELHRGSHRPYPCGAGAGYLGVSAQGDLAACHRFVGDAEGAMGRLDEGVDRDRQARWLERRHVHRQEPCRSCWARYLCGGGCHHEVIARGRPACDYIRGWLHYCLGAYRRLLARRPDYFGA